MNGQHQTLEHERKVRERALDKTVADTFPASDPPSTIPNPHDDTLLTRERDAA